MDGERCCGVAVGFRDGDVRSMIGPSEMHRVTLGYDDCVAAAQ